MKLNTYARRIQKGDRDAYSELITHYGKMVYYTALAELDDNDKALEVSKRVFREFFGTLQRNEIPDDAAKHLQRQVRMQCRALDSESSIMDSLLADIQASSDVDMIFGNISGASASAPVSEASTPASEVTTPVSEATTKLSPVAASIAAHVPDVEKPAAEPTVQDAAASGQTAASASVNSPAAEAAVASLAGDQVSPAQTTETVPPVPSAQQVSDAALTTQMNVVADNQIADKNSELYRQFYGQAEEVGHKKGRAGLVVGVILAIVLVIILVWLIIGLMGKAGVVTSIPDFGYTWFNSHVMPLF